MPDQIEKGRRFRELHAGAAAFVIPNPWDLGSARLLERLGFEALATTSAGFANSRGRRDARMGRDQMLAHAAEIAAATALPVSADLEAGYADSVSAVAETYRLAGAAGLAGASIEDTASHGDGSIYPVEVAAERVRAAAEAVHALPFPFMLTARAENFVAGNPDLKDTIVRLQAYQEAGADVLYAPGLMTEEQIAAVVAGVDRPVNVLAGLSGMSLTRDQLSDMGVKRISVGSGLARVAYGAFLRAARDMRNTGTFFFAGDAIPFRDLGDLLEP